MLEAGYRDGHRVIVDTPELVQYLLRAVQPHLPERVEMRGFCGQLRSLNERCRFLCYTPGQQFEAHTDGMYSRPAGHPEAGSCSLVTLQLYLHDVPAEHGGATTFLGLKGDAKVPCNPKVGSLLMFTQDLYHEGSKVLKGLKYTMRTEAMYQRVEPNNSNTSLCSVCNLKPVTDAHGTCGSDCYTQISSAPAEPTPAE